MLLLATFLVAGCGVIYRQPVFQGNLLESRSVDQLQVGMDRGQVFSLLGSPSVADPFHQSRWDYVATARRRTGDTEVKTLTSSPPRCAASATLPATRTSRAVRRAAKPSPLPRPGVAGPASDPPSAA